MSSTAPRVSPSGQSPEPDLARVRLFLVRLLPWLHGRARRQLPPRVLRRVGSTPEDLVQLAVLSVLARIETIRRQTGALPEWGASERQLRSYLQGVIWRTAMRFLRDHGACRTEPVEPDLLAEESLLTAIELQEESERARDCLSALTPEELRLAVGFGMGKSYAELSARLGASPDALAKRRERILKRLRARCARCLQRRINGCSMIPPGWP